MTINEFKEKLEKNKITLYKTKIEEDFYESNFIEFLEEDEFINFLINNNIKNVYYFYEKKSSDDYIIDYDMYYDLEDKLSENKYNRIEQKIDDYNYNLRHLEIFKKEYVHLLAEYNRDYYMYVLDDKNILSLDEPRDVLQKIVDDYS